MTTSRQKAKGSEFEREVVRVLRDHGHPYAERAYGAGRPEDRGDIDGLPGYCIEVKAAERLDVPGWVREAEKEAKAVGPGVVPVLVAKRRGRPAEEAYAVVRLADFAELVK